MKTFAEKAQENRRKRNADIADGLRNGEYESAAFDSMESFFPTRPIIKKDQAAIKRLYGDKDAKPDSKS
jgi:hypothetical protein